MMKLIKFTNEDLMKAMGLQLGDTIKYKNKIYTITRSEECQNFWIGYSNENEWYNIDNLINQEFEILKRPKKVGDLICDFTIHCKDCPLRFCNCIVTYNATLYEVLENKKNQDFLPFFDQEIYDLLKNRLDKEI